MSIYSLNVNVMKRLLLLSVNWVCMYYLVLLLCRSAVMSGGQFESETDNDDDDDADENTDTALAASVYHSDGQPTGGMSTFCHVLKHMFSCATSTLVMGDRMFSLFSTLFVNYL